MVIIDKDKCIGCGACYRDCFGFALRMEDGKAIVKKNCFLCGHCVAVCPADAVSITDMPADMIAYNPETFDLPAENVLNAIKFRRSIRDYQDRKVEKDKILRLLEAGRFTATGSNAQDVSYIVVQENLEALKPLVYEGLNHAADLLLAQGEGGNYGRFWKRTYEKYTSDPRPENDDVFFNAPMLLVLTSYAPINAALAAANIEMLANAEGLGCLYSGFIQQAIRHNPEAMQWLEIGNKDVSVCMLIGYPRVTYRRTAPRRPLQAMWK